MESPIAIDDQGALPSADASAAGIAALPALDACLSPSVHAPARADSQLLPTPDGPERAPRADFPPFSLEDLNGELPWPENEHSGLGSAKNEPGTGTG